MLLSPLTTNSKLHRAYWILTILNIVIFSLIFAAFPQWRYCFIEEDCFLENISAAAYLLAFLVGLAAFLRPASRRQTPLAAWIIPLLALLGFLDETSFLGLLAGADNPGSWCPTRASSPLVLPGGYVIDGVHDFFTIFFKILKHSGLSAYQITVLVIVFVGLPLVLSRKYYMPWIMKHCRRYPAFNFLRYGFILIVTAQFLDLVDAENLALSFTEELLEFNGGLALVFATAAMLVSIGNEKDSGASEEQTPP